MAMRKHAPPPIGAKELVCAGPRKHGVIIGTVLEVHCRYCTRLEGRRVYHRFDTGTGEKLPDRLGAQMQRT